MSAAENNPNLRRCPKCGAELPAGLPPDFCPKCLLKSALETQPDTGPSAAAAAPAGPRSTRGLPQPGEQLGHYRIIRPLGGGGMGAVFEVEDQENGRRVALKVLSQALDSPEARERFFREGRLAASLNHPNSVYVFGTEEIGGTPVIAMEFVAGGTLQDRIQARGPLPVPEAVDCVLQIIEGLEAAHRLGILHRDIKPSNCYLGEDGTVKIGDFGLSISTAIRTEPALTATGTFLGTPAFCSPEQLRGEELSARSDMYSVGATLYYLLTGRTPFESRNLVQLLATVLEQPAPSPRKVRGDIPQGLAKTVLRCLEKQPGDRFKNYADLAAALVPYGAAAPTPGTLGLRFLAGVVDMTILCLLAAVANLWVFGSQMAFLDRAMELSPKVLLCILGWFCLSTLYYALFEGLWGAAAGKALCRLRVVERDRNPPGFARAWLRALIYLLPPLLPYWVMFGGNPKAYLSTSQPAQMLAGFSAYAVMALLFATARRRNGFAAVQDLLTASRVISRSAFSSRPVLPGSEVPVPPHGSALTIGPYHVLQALTEAGATNWFLAYDLKLLRKVWVRVLPPGTPPVPAALRNLGRAGRLRWLTGRRSPKENWDAFAALTGQPFLQLAEQPRPWRDVRYWLHDLATEISAAERDGTRPELAFDRIWITAEGRAKLLDFPAPGLETRSEVRPSSAAPVLRSSGAEGGPPKVEGPKSESTLGPPIQPAQGFLGDLAAAALAGTGAASAKPACEVAVRLPLQARAFLRVLPKLAGVDAVVSELRPLLTRVAAVSRLRRTALVAGCAALPALACVGGIFGFTFLRELALKYPGLWEVNTLLQQRSSARVWGAKNPALPTDRQLAIYLAHHYRGLITNAASWSSPIVAGMISGDARKFAEQSVAENPAPTAAEIAQADAAVGKYVPERQFFLKAPPGLPVLVIAASLLVYVGLPAIVAALLFRGGLVLLIGGVTYVRKDGRRASRLRLFWRALVAWAPLLPVFALAVQAMVKPLTWQPWLGLVALGLLAAISVALPARGLQDRLAGTWPVPR